MQHDATLRFKPLTAANIADIIQLSDSSGLSQWTAQNYLDEMKLTNSVMLILESADGSLAGFVVGRIVPAADDAHAIDAEIYNIAVDERARRQGIGRKILGEFIRNCRQQFVRTIWLEVRASNASAIAFYEQHGFATAARRPRFYTDPAEDALLMKLSL